MFSLHKHALAYRFRWDKELDPQISPALFRGMVWHKIMEAHCGHIQAGATTMARREWIARYLSDVANTDQESADLLAWMFDGYEELYGCDPDWEVMAIEEPFICRLPTLRGRPSRFWLRLRADLIVRIRMGARRRIWVVDHKTSIRLPSERELEIDDQFGLYTYGVRQNDWDIFGSIHNSARTQHNKAPMTWEERFSRTLMYRTDQELETIAREAYQTARNAFSFPADIAPRSPDSDRCKWRCQFTEACLTGRKAGNRQENLFLESSGFVRISEDEQLARRGYGEQPPRPPGRD